MYCQKCGSRNEDGAERCVQCAECLRPVPPTVRAAPQTSGLAIGSLVSSVLGIFMCFFVGQIVGIVLGHMARKEIRASQGRITGDGLATAGIITGWVGIVLDVLIVLFMVFFFMAAAVAG
jgi:hypothetical protein